MNVTTVRGEEHLHEVDLCLVVDTTASMGPFIESARERLHETLCQLERTVGVSLRVGLVEYRDHPPQETSFVTKIHEMTEDLSEARGYVASMWLGGGGDEAEAVLRGMHDACTRTSWRPHALRFAMLVGDAPPHAYEAWEEAPARGASSYGDGFASGCPSGLDVRAVTAAAESHRVVVHAVCMTSKWVTMSSFRDLSVPTGGTCTYAQASTAIDSIREVLTVEFSHMPTDRRVLRALGDDPIASVDALARRLDEAPSVVAASLGRLARRALI